MFKISILIIPLQVWIFDQPDGSARILRSRTGHSGTPNKCV